MEKNEVPVDYYTKRSQKFVDFFIGFLGSLIFPLLVLLMPLGSILIIVYLILLIPLCILLFKSGRRFIAVGIIAMSLIPVLIFGSCILFLGIGG